jgi:hypothetical protein
VEKVAHTSAQRDQHELCGAKKKNGELCRKFAGEGTEHPGIGACKYHLGRTKNANVAAQKKMAQKVLHSFGQPIPVEPTEALLAVLHLSAGHLQYVKDEYEVVEDKSSFMAQSLMRAFNEERDRIARIAKAALDAGVAERQVKIAEAYGAQLATLLRNVLEDEKLKLTTRQQAAAPAVIRKHLLSMGDRPQLLSGEPSKR